MIAQQLYDDTMNRDIYSQPGTPNAYDSADPER